MWAKVYRFLDAFDALAVRFGLLKGATWSQLMTANERKLYAGRLSRNQPQFSTHFGLTPFTPSRRNISHDLRNNFPISDNSIHIFQATDVFEHIAIEEIPKLIAEVYRILVPGGLFRLSVPDYRCPIYLERTITTPDGDLLFDPGGGGRLRNGRVVDGGHVWFPVFEKVEQLMENSEFSRAGKIEYLHYHDPSGERVMNPIDYSLGFILRTPDNDSRVQRDCMPLSIVVDAWKAVKHE